MSPGWWHQAERRARGVWGMHRYFARACLAVATGVALSLVGVSGASASGVASRAVQAALVSSAGTSQATVGPGAQLWAKLYNGNGGTGSDADSVAVSPDGKTVFVTGVSGGYATVAYNATTGAQRWVSRYGGSGQAVSVAVSPDGSTVFVTGGIGAGTFSGFDYATVAYNAATGAKRWAKLYSGVGIEGGQALWLAVSPDGKTVFVTGDIGTDNGSQDYATLAYNAATGAQRWVKSYNGTGKSTDIAYSVAVSPDGKTVFVTGASTGTSSPLPTSDYATIAYNAATGAQKWVKRYNGPVNSGNQANSVTVSPDGSTVFVTGASGASGEDYYATIAYNAATGAQQWVKRYNGGNFGGGAARSMAISPDGKTVYVTGYLNGATSGADYATIAYNAATGAQQWVKRYNGTGRDDLATSVAVSPGGATVYVTGYSQDTNDELGYATVAYDAATGAQQWASRHDGTGTGGGDAFSVAVSSTGTVFVTGVFRPGTNSPDEYATIAYHG